MKINLTSLEQKARTIIKDIGRQAQQANVCAYLVGGLVRDLILHRANFDLDMVVEGDAIALAKRWIQNKEGVNITDYPPFGTVTIEHQDGLRLDLATARKEQYVHPGALPSVSPGTIRDDLFRRDFTINAIACHIHPRRMGEVVDPYGGVKDLRQKKIRVLHEQSFVDDPTRILRAIRFEQRFGFHIEPKTLGLLKSALERGVVHNVKPNRYFEEFRKSLQEPFPLLSLQRLSRLRAMDFLKKDFQPHWGTLKKVEANIAAKKRQPFFRNKDWHFVYFMALVESLPREDRGALIGKFQFTRSERRNLLDLTETPLIMKTLDRPGLSPSTVFKMLSSHDEELVYFLAVRSCGNNVSHYTDQYLRKWKHIQLEVTGDDVKRMGHVTGEKIGEILDSLFWARLDGRLRMRSQQLAEAQRLILQK